VCGKASSGQPDRQAPPGTPATPGPG
jgi:hypothetical protein